MAFSDISNFVNGDYPGMQRWALEHYLDHCAINGALETLSYAITTYPIQSLRTDEYWLAAHQRWHQAVWTAVGAGVSTDFSQLNWKNDGDVYDWLQLHAAVHADIRQAVGL